MRLVLNSNVYMSTFNFTILTLRLQLHFHVSLVPQEIYKYVHGEVLQLLPALANSSTSTLNCIARELESDHKDPMVHHATPLLKVTLCDRGECVPDIHNTVMFAIVHIREEGVSVLLHFLAPVV